jgi:hypothetical protein
MTKRTIIKKIRTIIKEFGSFNISEVEHEENILLRAIKKDHTLLIEGFEYNGVKVTEYVHETETDTFNIYFEDVKVSILEEVLRICENYEAEMLKTEKRIS